MYCRPPIQLSEETTPAGGSLLILSGRVTVACAGEFHRAALILCGRAGHVTVDCAAAEYLDTSATQLLMSLRRELERAGQGCDIVGASAAVREDFRLSGFLAGSRG